jgi:hypothetical protein
MRLTGTILRCLARKVNSGGKGTYVTNPLVLDPDNSTGTNYGVEVLGRQAPRSAADVQTFLNRGRQQEHGRARRPAGYHPRPESEEVPAAA